MRVASSADDAVSALRSGHRVYVHEAAMALSSLIGGLTERARALESIEVVHLHTNAEAPYVAPDLAGHVRHNALFVGPNVRAAVEDGRADFTPVFLSGSRRSSATGRCRSTSRWCRSRRPTGTATARSGSRSRRREARSITRGS
jgi:acyl-CoA hydrolase